jgi:pimeloyl-ACP methyl ester carboxylesterase
VAPRLIAYVVGRTSSKEKQMTYEPRSTRRTFVTQLGTMIGVTASGVLPFAPDSVATAQVPAAKGRRTGFLRRPGAEVFYEVSGAGPALVFAHGAGGNYLSWWQQVPYFSQQFTCVTFSQRTFAPSTEVPDGPGPAAFVNDLGALIDHLGLADVVLIAQSLGGRTCLPYALENQRRVRGLVMASNVGWVDYSTIQHPEVGRAESWTREAQRNLAELNEQGVHPGAGPRMAREQPALAYLYRQIDDMTDAKRKQRRAQMQPSVPPPSLEVVKRLSVRTLFLTGEEDFTVFPGASSALASVMLRASVESVPRAGHSVYFERAEAFNRLVDAFLLSL